MAKLRIAGTWVGVIDLELENWTVAMLREEVAKRSNAQRPDSINLISAGKVLKDGDGSQNLTQLGIRNNAKILATRVSVDEGKSLEQELMAEEERSRRLARVKAAATALSKRHVDGSLPIEDFNIELENQGGQKVQLGTETDQRAVMMGLMLHENAKNLLTRQLYKDALEVLTMGEEAFSLCDPKVLELQVPDEALSHVMSMGFKERDARRALRLNNQDIGRAVDFLFEEKAKRKQKREDDIQHRIEIMELKQYGVTPLKKAVNVEKLKELVAIGFEKKLAAEALRRNENDFQKALDDLTNPETNSAIQIDIESRKRKREQRAVNARIEELFIDNVPILQIDMVWCYFLLRDISWLSVAGIRLEKAREGLERCHGKDFSRVRLLQAGCQPELALHMRLELLEGVVAYHNGQLDKSKKALTSAQAKFSQLDIESRKRKREQRAVNARIEELVSMGFDRSRDSMVVIVDILVTRVVAVVQAGETMEQTMSRLLPEVDPLLAFDANSSGNPASEASNLNPDSVEGPLTADEERDVEMEDELARDIGKADALSDYDIEVTKEGEAIQEYLALLASTDSKEALSSC
ncbi:hypothetical protein GOBAR_DD04014 [Gossypium barbadense]|nr:hypothetical protein GOBAR_DD04014 [Gossypium barbadense]